MAGRSPDPLTPAWLTAACSTLLETAPGPDRLRKATSLGAQAAEQSHDPHHLTRAMLTAATSAWARTPAAHSATVVRQQAEELLTAIVELLDAATTGFHDRTRAELSGQDSQRAEFVHDLLTGRADPGRLAERAQRYGIRLTGDHVVAVAVGDGLTGAVARRIDDMLAARYGAGNTLTSLRDRYLVCISTAGLRGLPAELAHHLINHLGASGWQIGVGRPHPGTAAARQLHLSVRAVTYRLERIHTLTGYHPSEPTQRFTLHTAVLGARLLGWPAGT